MVRFRLRRKVRHRRGMVSIPAGCFTMGSNSGGSDEKPPRKVCLSAFQLDRYEVTVAKYRRYLGRRSPPSSWYKSSSKYCNYGKDGRGKHPMNCVSWHGANGYCRWLGKRLPTEAQWEFAARGTTGRKYPWGNQRPSCRLTVMDDGGDGCGKDRTWPVGSKRRDRSPFGVRDMGGNVREWVADCYSSGFYRTLSSGARDPAHRPTSKNCANKSIRGGSWFYGSAWYFRAAYRSRFRPTLRDNIIGFRCALPAPGP